MIREPHKRAAAVTLSDSTTIGATRGLFVGGAGAVKVTMKNGTDVTFSAVPAGTTLLISVTKVYSAGTTATAIVALY